MSEALLPADCFYERLSPTRFRSTAATVGPWSPMLQHGGPPAALLAHVLEQVDPRPGTRLARISIEILGPLAVDELTVETEVLRPGKRIQLLAAVASLGGRPVLRATAWQLLAEPGRGREAGPRESPPPFPPPQELRFFPNVPVCGYGDAMDWRFVSGGFHELGPATVWARTRVPVVKGEPVSRLSNLLAMVDSANGVSAEVPVADFTFVPVDLNVVLHRAPEGQWAGMHATTTLEDDGVGFTRTRLFDARGSVGGSLHTLFVSKR